MKAKEVMTQSAVCCEPETNVGSAVELMWNLWPKNYQDRAAKVVRI